MSEAKCSALDRKYVVIPEKRKRIINKNPGVTACETVQVHSQSHRVRTVFSHPQRTVSYPPSTAPWSLYLWVSPLHTVCLTPCPKTSIPKDAIINVYWSTAEQHLSEEKVGVMVAVETGIGGWNGVGLGGELALLCSATLSNLPCIHTHKHSHTPTHKDSLIDSRLDTQFRGETIPLYPSLHQIFKHLY